MANTSATGGYLRPELPWLAGDDLDDVFQRLTVGITGLPGSMVRPRWQADPPKTPEHDQDWVALGVTVETPDAGPSIQHRPAGEGHDIETRHFNIDVQFSCYGPHAAALAQAIRSGLSIPQNIEQIRPIGFVSTGQAVRVPELVNQRHYNRVDFTAFFRLARQQRYAVLNVLEAPLQLNKD